MDISGLGSLSTDYYASLVSGAGSSALTEKISSTGFADRLKEASEALSSESQNDELMDVCKQFESYLLEQVFKGMEKTIMRADDDKDPSTSNLVDIFKDQAIQKISEQSTETQGLGLAQMLYDQLQRNLGISPDSIAFAQLTGAAEAAGTAAAAEEEK